MLFMLCFISDALLEFSEVSLILWFSTLGVVYQVLTIHNNNQNYSYEVALKQCYAGGGTTT